MGQPGFWDDTDGAAKVNAEYAKVNRRLTTYNGLEADVADLDGLVELADEDPELGAEVEEKLAELEEQRLFAG